MPIPAREHIRILWREITPEVHHATGKKVVTEEQLHEAVANHAAIHGLPDETTGLIGYELQKIADTFNAAQ